MALLFGLSSQPIWMPPGPPGNDKLIHFAAYFVLGVLCWFALETPASGSDSAPDPRPPALRWRVLGWPPAEIRRWTLAAAIGALYGASDEIHQLYVPGRFGDWGDFGADAMGAIVGARLAAWRRRRT